MSFNRKTGKNMNKRRKWGKLTLIIQIIMVITLLVVFAIMIFT